MCPPAPIQYLEFDVLPHDISLEEPATISIKFDKKDPIVERLDDNDSTWEKIPDVSVSNGDITFSAQKLGKFRVYSKDTDQTNTSDASSGSIGGGGGRGCFITTAIL